MDAQAVEKAGPPKPLVAKIVVILQRAAKYGRLEDASSCVKSTHAMEATVLDNLKWDAEAGKLFLKRYQNDVILQRIFY